jgi:hypothetical protein
MALTTGLADGIWPLTDGAHGANGASDRSEESFSESFRKMLLTIEIVGHIWRFTDETRPSGLARSRFTNR